MTNLISSENDYDVAHRDTHLDDVYRELLGHAIAKDPAAYPWSFESVPGLFVQATDPALDDRHFDYTQDFGRLKSWPEVNATLERLNAEDPNVHYKLVYFARHGQGPHNVIVDKYGIDQWHEKYKYIGLDEDTGLEYAPDPPLTAVGESQAEENHQAWAKQIADGAAVPTKFYVSPLQRSCQTLAITWQDLLPTTVKPVVCELLRETIGINLCDKRSHREVIEQRFPTYCTSRLHHHDDELFCDDVRESFAEQSVRCNQFLQHVFSDNPDDIVVSTTSHGGTIRAFITVVGHPKFCISTGGMIPMVIKATKRK
ncbi:probable phosphoglycerate mutase Pmu1p [Diutina catenulata]